MGFLEGVGNYVKEEMEANRKAYERVERRTSNKSNEEVIKMYKNAHGYEKYAYQDELVRRGCMEEKDDLRTRLNKW